MKIEPLELDTETQSQILDLYIAGGLDLSTIADLCCISFDRLVAFLDDPRTTASLKLPTSREAQALGLRSTDNARP